MAKKWLSVADVAGELDVSIDTIRNWINRRNDPLPAVKVGRDWRIKRDDLDAFLEKRKNIHQEDAEQ